MHGNRRFEPDDGHMTRPKPRPLARQSIVEHLRAEGCDVDFASADVGHADEVRRVAEFAVARLGGIDSWINCGGVANYARLVDTPEDENQRLFRTNYFGVVHGCLAALPHLRDAGGELIMVGLIAGDIPSPMMGTYAASKHAVKGYVESLQIEVSAEVRRWR